ncbi:diacylglycerol O-acyltransferase [Nocardioides albertanoniae]|uniref:Diacylglycerol O-acyltransferase n=2 Tax=Nocardioides albertanoniae TaxID=1175486 RepID=A0A543AAR4_9ACTN|nr:diacylglycerol O-acyltransferase [Nocardioides albertanoniae]
MVIGMSDRLGPRDVAYLDGESLSVPHQVASIELIEPKEGFDYGAFAEHVEDRLAFVPRYRQRVRMVPGRIAYPVWADDDRFDLTYHVRRSALPRPGSMDQLLDLAGRIVSRPLDRSRPLWELYVIEGLEGGRVALVTKTHQALVDGAETVDLVQLLLDDKPEVGPTVPDLWEPQPESGARLLAGAVVDAVTSVRGLTGAARSMGGFALGRATGVAKDIQSAGIGVAQALTRRPPERPTPLSGALSQQRRVVTLQADLSDFRRIRDTHGGTVNDVILAVVTGGLRSWLMTRQESLAGVRQVPALVPVSVIDEELDATQLGSAVAPHFVVLPVAEPSPVVRLHQVSYSFEQHKETARTVSAQQLAGISGFAPATFHVIGSRVAAESEHDYLLSVCNVPGPQEPRYAAGSRLVASYPIHPLAEGHSLAIGVTSYDGQVFFAITADRDLVPDASLVGQCLSEAIDELLDTASGRRFRAPRGLRVVKNSGE